jgi:hypothetical protein
MPPRKRTIVANFDATLNAAIMSNGHPKKLLQLLDYHERAAHAIRTTLELLDADAHESSTRRIATTIRTAQGIDAMRHAARSTENNPPAKRGRPRKKAPRSQTAVNVKAQRQRTADILATLDRKEPRPFPPDVTQLAGVLSRRGYVKRIAKGQFLRTAKEFHP